jgi:hypothetical protein
MLAIFVSRKFNGLNMENLTTEHLPRDEEALNNGALQEKIRNKLVQTAFDHSLDAWDALRKITQEDPGLQASADHDVYNYSVVAQKAIDSLEGWL